MTQKEALKQIEEYCKYNMHLTVSSFSRGHYALVIHDALPIGNTVIEGSVPCHRLSGYLKPTELLIWLDGYHAGLQNSNLNKSGNEVQV